MNKGDDIRKPKLADKLAGYQPTPPASVWDGVVSQIGGGKSRRPLFILLFAAAGLLLAVTVGLRFIFPEHDIDVAVVSELDDGANEQLGEIRTEVIISEDYLADETQGLVIVDGSKNDRTAEKGRDDSIDAERIVEGNSEKGQRRREERVREVIVAFAAEQELEKESYAYLEQVDSVEVLDHEVVDLGEMQEVETSLADSLKDDAEMTIEEAEAFLSAKKDELIIQEKKEERKGKWQLGAILTPQYSYRDVASTDVVQNALVNSAESGKITYATGLQFSYLANSKLTIESGVFYNKMGVNIGDYNAFSFNGSWKESDMVYAPENKDMQVVNMSNSIGTVVSEDRSLFVNSYGGVGVSNDYHLMSPEIMSAQGEDVQYLSQSFEYLEIPLNLKYKVYEKKLIIQLIGGISTNFLVNNKVEAHTVNMKVDVGEVADVRSVNYSGNAGFGFLYNIYDHLTFSLEPRFRYYLHSINSASLPSTRPYAFGLQTGFSYTF